VCEPRFFIFTEKAASAYLAQTPLPQWDLVGFLDFVDHWDLYSLAKRNRASFLLEKLHSRRALGKDPGPKVIRRSTMRTFVDKLKKSQCSHQRLKQENQRLHEINGQLARVNELEQENAALQKCVICTKPYSGTEKTSCSRCGQIACKECVIKWASEVTMARAEEIAGSAYNEEGERKAAIGGAARALVMLGGITFKCPYCKGERLGSSLSV
jgi:hypothetical protein